MDCAITSELKKTLWDRSTSSVAETLFDAAQRDIVKLMRMDCYPRFLSSEHYKSALLGNLPSASPREPQLDAKRATSTKNLAAKSDPKSTKKRDAAKRDNSVERNRASASRQASRSPNKGAGANNSLVKAKSINSLPTSSRVDRAAVGSCEQLGYSGDEPNAAKKKHTIMSWFRSTSLFRT